MYYKRIAYQEKIKLKDTLIIFERIDKDYASDDLAYLWTGYNETKFQKSILEYVDRTGEYLKSKYLEFIHDLGEYNYKSYTIKDYFQFGNDPSLWWMSLLVEKSPYKSENIKDCLKLLAIENIIKDNACKRVVLAFDNKSIAIALSNLCNKIGIDFIWMKTEVSYINIKLHREFISSVFNILVGFAYLFYYFFSRWKFRASKPKKIFDQKSVFFSSYFFNLDIKKVKEGNYCSRQWGKLPAYLNQIGQATIHLENYVKSPEIPNVRLANNFMNYLNRRESLDEHIFVDTNLSLRIFFKIFIKYIKLIYLQIRFSKTYQAFKVNGSNLNFWPQLRDDWNCSFLGKSAVSNLIYIELFDQHLRELPYQKFGFYLCENIGWEKALIAAWNKHHHGNLVAVPHSTVRFWDLRYFSDPKININENYYNVPVPNFYALNGEIAWEHFSKNGYSKTKLLKAEALRYQFLENHFSHAKIPHSSDSKINKQKVLILGDFTEKQTHLMLDDLESIFNSYKYLPEYTIKPHPVSNINIKKYTSIGLRKNDGLLQDILKEYDVVFSSNTTNACVDCLLMGAKVIIFMDSDELNHNPLRGIEGIQFVRSPDELYTALNSKDNNKINYKNETFFWLNSEIPLWKSIIKKLSNKENEHSIQK
jgi:surface carbohydrate biosynthesis protein (TIGR04326 family)